MGPRLSDGLSVTRLHCTGRDATCAAWPPLVATRPTPRSALSGVLVQIHRPFSRLKTQPCCGPVGRGMCSNRRERFPPMPRPASARLAPPGFPTGSILAARGDNQRDCHRSHGAAWRGLARRARHSVGTNDFTGAVARKLSSPSLAPPGGWGTFTAMAPPVK